MLGNGWLILVKGGGDLGTGVAWRLFGAGFPVVVTELPDPLVIRRTVAFASAVWNGRSAVEGVEAVSVDSPDAAREALRAGRVPVLVDPEAGCRAVLRPRVVVDAIMAKVNTGTRRDDAPLVMALGPGFEAGVDCHAVIETSRGHTLGRVYWQGRARDDTGTPGRVEGYAAERVLRAPCDGALHVRRQIGDRVAASEVIAEVEGAPIRAPFPGVVRGLIRDGRQVSAGLKVGDVDPRGVREHCFTISDKALAVGGAALWTIMAWAAGHGGDRSQATR